jgi:nitric oxide reductase NorD protein
MGDAEDVLIAAAERVGAATRALWERGRAPRDGAALRAARAERRIATWLEACFGAALPIGACDAPSAAGWLERALGRPAPWQERPCAAASSDGVRLLLPRARLCGEAPADAERLLLAALAQGLRLAQARARPAPGSALERDVHFALEAALGDAELAAALPGLAPALDAAREAARAGRPPLARLRPAEREVEALVRALLEGPAREAASRAAAELGTEPQPAAIVAFAARFAGRRSREAGGYRGVAPVEHWGVPAEALEPAVAAERPPGPSPAPSRRPSTRSLPRRVRRRPASEEDAASRSGAFVVPHGDAHLAVQDARGLVRPEDRGEEDAEALAEELARAGELPAVRNEGGVREVLESERSGEGRGGRGAAPRGARAFVYPEWDAGRGAYRDPGIVLRESWLSEADLVWAARMRREQGPLLARLRRHFEALRPRREWVGRQLEGDGIDVDALVAEHAERRAGLAPHGRVYRRERPRRRDVAVALLVDASGSTDAWVSRNERVIDVAKQAALCLGEALAALGDRHAVYAFSGRGPGDVRVRVAKRFAEPWSESVRGRIGAIQPDRSTRLGGPIRHATARLARERARTRLLLVLSDGKPDDEDVYEGRYGLEDVRQAVFEARRAGVHPFCVTIDRSGPSYLPHLFGASSYTVLWDVGQLPTRLPAIYRHLTL